jgi:carbohydrate kinase (thermoresistant glucokinase family)
MGVAGCGKSSVGVAVANILGAVYSDGDDLHPASNIAKMSAGTPLDDDDRAPWLDLVGEKLRDAEGAVLIGCSALKRAYRDRIRAAAGSPVTFLHLSGSRLVIEGRMSAREGHFMPVALLDSQFATLEPLQDDELSVIVDIDQTFEAVVAESAAGLQA